MIEAAEYADLCRVSALVGRDPELVQGPGGNTSIKNGNELVVKASGTWLADAERQCIFVRVGLDSARALETDAAVGELETVPANPGEPGDSPTRASIEAALHAVMPHRAVIHVHCVDTIALAVCLDAEDRLEPVLDGLGWGFVPYCKPGAALTAAVRSIVAARPVDVLVLGNHGLVVGGDSIDAAHELLGEVRVRLARSSGDVSRARIDPVAEQTELDLGPDWRLPMHASSHEIAFDRHALGIAQAGSMYPDHVVFLGSAVALYDGNASVEAYRSKLLVLPGSGVRLRADVGRAGDEMARAISEVSKRVPRDARVRYLSDEEEWELVNWDAEKYRRGLGRA